MGWLAGDEVPGEVVFAISADAYVAMRVRTATETQAAQHALVDSIRDEQAAIERADVAVLAAGFAGVVALGCLVALVAVGVGR